MDSSFVTPVTASWHQPGSPNRADHDFGISLSALPAIAAIRKTGQRRRIAGHDIIIRESGSTGFNQHVEGVTRQPPSSSTITRDQRDCDADDRQFSRAGAGRLPRLTAVMARTGACAHADTGETALP